MVWVPTAIPNPRRMKTQAKNTPAIHRKMNANQVNGSPGLPAWWASANSKADPVTAKALATGGTLEITGDDSLTAGSGSSSLTLTDNGTIEFGQGSSTAVGNSGQLDLHASSTNLLTGTGTVIMSGGISNQLSFDAGSAGSSDCGPTELSGSAYAGPGRGTSETTLISRSVKAW